MKISTRRTQGIQSGKDSARPRRKPAAPQKKSQKVSRSRISLQRIFYYARWAVKLGCAALIVLSIIWIGVKAYHSEIFRVGNIAVYGCRELNPRTVEQIVRDNIPANILDINLEQLKKTLEQVQWIKQVEIRRVLPSGLIIRVQERTPSVVLEMDGQLMIADSNGILLDKYDPRYGKLDVPVFRGIVGKDADSYRSCQQENSDRIRNALNMLAEIGAGETQYLKKISEVDISDQGNLKIMLVDDTAEISLGNRDYFKRLQTLMTSPQYQMLKKDARVLVKVDLRSKTEITYGFAHNVSESPSK
jgi:cell division septal protein FtsQ